MSLRQSILIVEDEALIAEGLRLNLESMDIDVCGVAATADDAIDLAEQYHPRVVLMDVRLRGERDGVDAAVVIDSSIGSKIIFITGSREPATIARMQKLHRAAVLFKPFSQVKFRDAVETALRG